MPPLKMLRECCPLSTGLEAARQLGAWRVPRAGVTKDESRGYRSYYSGQTRGLVADWYQPEIALLGYGF